jgi:hypothetical protein
MDTYTERWNCLWAISLSSRYHARRQAFFERWHRVSTGVAGVLGSAAAANALGHGGIVLTATAGFIVAGMSAIDLVVGTAKMAQTHHELRRRFLVVEAEIQTANEEPTEKEVNRWRRKRLEIEADEPPLYNGLNLLCENELARALGRTQRAQLNAWQRLTSHWFHWYDLAPKLPDPPAAEV